MENWPEIQAKFIASLRKNTEVFSNVLSKDPSNMVIDVEKRTQLEALLADSTKILNKLESKEFDVAIVGLEKAGKSTLGNALLKINNVLPEYSERCTYTTTEIRSGSEDVGEVFFYTYEEFNNDFKKRLATLKFEGQADFSTLDIATFERFWESMKNKSPELYKYHSGKTDADILAILRERSLIKSYLGQSPKKFVGASALQSQDFQIFITGIKGYREDGEGGKIVERSGHPYAVKQVNIRSANLLDMSHIVLHDVPGFDSPTQLHKEQTENRMREADAIIFVSNVGDRPNLNGPQLDVLRTVDEVDGIYLSDKAFVFGNKIDTVDEQTAKNNRAALKSDVAKYHIAKSEHVFCGSAKAYLDVITGNNDSKSVVTLNNWGMSNGVEELRKSMQDYYENDRFDILKKRAERVIQETEKFLRAILEDTRGKLEQIQDGGEYLLQIKNALLQFHKEIKPKEDEYIKAIKREQPFSKLIVDNIEEIYASISPETDIVIANENERVADLGDVYPVTAIDTGIREDLQRLFTKEIVSRTAKATSDREQKIYEELSEKFLEVLGVDVSSPYYDELKETSSHVFDDIKVANDGETCRFNTLVKRFTTGLIEALIRHPYADDARLSRVKDESLPEFFSLAAYYSAQNSTFGQDIDLAEESEYLQFFSKIFTHGMPEENVQSENLTALKNFFKDQKDNEDSSLDTDKLPLGDWAKMLDKAGLSFGDKTVKGALERAFYKNDWISKALPDKTKVLGEIIASACQVAGKDMFEAGGLKARLKSLHEEAQREKDASLKQIDENSSSKDEKNAALKKLMLDSINADIISLRDITVKSVVKAIGLEQAFCSVILDNIEYIRKEAEDNSANNRFDIWINQNKRKIRENEYAAIVRAETDNRTRKNIIDNIEDALNKLQQSNMLLEGEGANNATV